MMDRKTVFLKLDEVFCDVLDLDEITLNDATTMDDVEDWDSLSHVHLVMEIQKAFGIKFTSLEIISWKNVGEMVDSILSKMNDAVR